MVTLLIPALRSLTPAPGCLAALTRVCVVVWVVKQVAVWIQLLLFVDRVSRAVAARETSLAALPATAAATAAAVAVGRKRMLLANSVPVAVGRKRMLLANSVGWADAAR